VSGVSYLSHCVDTHSGARSFLFSVPPLRVCLMNVRGLLGSVDTLVVSVYQFFDPGSLYFSPPAAKEYVLPSVSTKTSATAKQTVSRLNSWTHSLAVYASSPQLLATMQDSLRDAWVGLSLQHLLRGYQLNVSVMLYTTSPSTRLS
jgi:hypothetical protein